MRVGLILTFTVERIGTHHTACHISFISAAFSAPFDRASSGACSQIKTF